MFSSMRTESDFSCGKCWSQTLRKFTVGLTENIREIRSTRGRCVISRILRCKKHFQLLLTYHIIMILIFPIISWNLDNIKLQYHTHIPFHFSAYHQLTCFQSALMNFYSFYSKVKKPFSWQLFPRSYQDHKPTFFNQLYWPWRFPPPPSPESH